MITADRAELVRRYYAAWSASDVDALLAVVHPDITFHPILGVLYERGAFHGHADMAEHVRQLHSEWDAFDAHVDSTHDAGDLLVAFVTLAGRRGGRDYEARIAVDVGFRDGLISSFVGRDIWEAAEDLGVDV
jgi:ketosteroid isomerase-like protein